MTHDELFWQCGDCGNTYDFGIDSCPNKLLDQLSVNKAGHEIRKTKKSKLERQLAV